MRERGSHKHTYIYMFKWRDKKGGIREEETEYEKEREKKKEWRNMWRYRQGVRYREIQFFVNFVNDIILFILFYFLLSTDSNFSFSRKMQECCNGILESVLNKK